MPDIRFDIRTTGYPVQHDVWTTGYPVQHDVRTTGYPVQHDVRTTGYPLQHDVRTALKKFISGRISVQTIYSVKPYIGVYIMQNTMVVGEVGLENLWGGGEMRRGKVKKLH